VKEGSDHDLNLRRRRPPLPDPSFKLFLTVHCSTDCMASPFASSSSAFYTISTTRRYLTNPILRLPRCRCASTVDQTQGKGSNHYETLGLGRDSSKGKIKERFYQLSRELHPDSPSSSVEKTVRFQHISEAYSILSDERSRRSYDASLAQNHQSFVSPVDRHRHRYSHRHDEEYEGRAGGTEARRDRASAAWGGKPPPAAPSFGRRDRFSHTQRDREEHDHQARYARQFGRIARAKDAAQDDPQQRELRAESSVLRWFQVAALITVTYFGAVWVARAPKSGSKIKTDSQLQRIK